VALAIATMTEEEKGNVVYVLLLLLLLFGWERKSVPESKNEGRREIQINLIQFE